AEKVFGVEPAADGHHGWLDVLKMRARVARLPEVVVVRVLHHLIPEGDFAFEILLVDVGKRPDAEKELIAVRREVRESRRGLRRGLRGRFAEAGKEVEGMRQK